MHTFNTKYEATMLSDLLHANKNILNNIGLIEAQIMVRIITNMKRNDIDHNSFHVSFNQYTNLLNMAKITENLSNNIVDEFQSWSTEFQVSNVSEYIALHNFLFQLFKIIHSTKKFSSNVLEINNQTVYCTSHNYFSHEFQILMHHNNLIKIEQILKEHLSQTGVDIFLVNGQSEIKIH